MMLLSQILIDINNLRFKMGFSTVFFAKNPCQHPLHRCTFFHGVVFDGVPLSPRIINSEHEWHESNELLFVRFVLFVFVNIDGGCIK